MAPASDHFEAADHDPPPDTAHVRAAVVAERIASDAKSICTEVGAGYLCTRTIGHPGRHLATSLWGVSAAWPGTAVPSEADLNAQPGGDR